MMNGSPQASKKLAGKTAPMKKPSGNAVVKKPPKATKATPTQHVHMQTGNENVSRGR